jgi:hypothetical protein
MMVVVGGTTAVPMKTTGPQQKPSSRAGWCNGNACVREVYGSYLDQDNGYHN